MTIPAVPPPQSLAAAAAAVGEPAAAPPPAATPPPPAAPVVSVSQWEEAQKALKSSADTIKALQDKQTRFEKAMNLLNGKTDENTAALPPNVVSELAVAKSAAEKAWRTLHAQTMAGEAKAHNAAELANALRDNAVFAVDANGGLIDPSAASRFVVEHKTRNAWAYQSDTVAAVTQAPAVGPGAGTRPPVPQQPGVSAPVKPAPPPYLTDSQLREKSIQFQREYVAAVRAAGGTQQ